MKTSILGDKRSRAGHALSETLVSLILVSVIILTGVRLLITEWTAWKCSRELFEAVHYARTHALSSQQLSQSMQIDIQETMFSFKGKNRCSGRTHEIELPKVDYAENKTKKRTDHHSHGVHYYNYDLCFAFAAYTTCKLARKGKTPTSPRCLRV